MIVLPHTGDGGMHFNLADQRRFHGHDCGHDADRRQELD